MTELANSTSSLTNPLYACLYRLPLTAADAANTQVGGDEPRRGGERAEGAAVNALAAIAQECSPRYEMHGDDLAVIDVAGLQRLLGPPPAIGDELRRAVTTRGFRAHVAIASTQTAAMVLALAQPGLTIVQSGAESDALAPIGLDVLRKFEVSDFILHTLRRWGVSTLGALAGLPSADLVSRFGRSALAWQAIARGEDVRPLVPALDEERFDATLELEWPVDQVEPLSFVLTRLLEPLSIRLERRDRGAAVLHVLLGLVTREVYARRLELPSPMREVRALRTIALLDLESHPPPAPIDRVTVVIDPTPGRVLQHTLFTRAQLTPEQLSTLLARLSAVIGQDRIGAAATVDTHRPGAFGLEPFRGDAALARSASGASAALELVSAVRRCRQPVPARVAVTDGRPVRVTSDRRGFTGGSVVQVAGPWRASGHWWEEIKTSWDRDEWEVALTDGGVYRVFHDHQRDAWFIESIVD